ncbi:MAG: histidine phosphatase family protein [Anaerolineales bacterium]|nr:histidine phosphatase family protein [Anaerolineales bacterium]
MGSLAESLQPYQPGLVVTSLEPKAVQTGEILAQTLGIPWTTGDDLHEHRREGGRILSREQFQAQIAALFARPEQPVFGLETARQALDRFSKAIEALPQRFPQINIAVVTHGTVMSLYYEALTGEDPYLFWCQLGLPAFYTFYWPDRVINSVVTQIET